MSEKKIYIQKPKKEYAQEIFRLIKNCKVLDVNSEYLYLLQTTHFKECCTVALCDNEVVGYVSGYKIPHHEDKLFIWQVAIDEKLRGIGLANKLILNTLRRKINSNVRYIHTTVSPDNNSSIKMFSKLAKSLETNMKSKNFFKKEDFINQHEEEVLYEIGPIKQKGLK